MLPHMTALECSGSYRVVTWQLQGPPLKGQLTHTFGFPSLKSELNDRAMRLTTNADTCPLKLNRPGAQLQGILEFMLAREVLHYS